MGLYCRVRQSSSRKPRKQITPMEWGAYYLHPRPSWPDNLRLHRSERLFQACPLELCANGAVLWLY